MKKIKLSLALQIFIGMVLGVIVGAIFYENPKVETILQPIGDTFLNLIKVIILPIIISTLITGVASLGDAKKFAKLGGKTILYFEIITTIAMTIGLIAANIVKPGSGIDKDSLTKSDLSGVTNTAKSAQDQGIVDTITGIFPSNIFESLAAGDILPVIFFSILFGLGLSSLGKKGEPLLQIFQTIGDTMFWITNKIMKLAPLGVFALIGVTISKFGLSSLLPLGKLVLTSYGVMIIFSVLVFGLVLKICHVNPIDFIKVLKNEIILAFSTASSEVVLPNLIKKMNKFGCPKEITSFVIPSGYSFNLDGGALYQSIAVLFVAQMYGIDMSIGSQITALFILMLTTKGLAGVPGANIAVLLATFGPLGLPLEGLAFIVGVDRFIDMGRTVINVSGNSIAAIVISKWEGVFNTSKSKEYIKELEN
ncbi:cation:dicarboxylate symporter family transporter [Staphylococcus shinii]|uniref:cation:dicarboxylate symporter family transporter n=1 Tax=Staphylococcus shinii TaxID=2912228 RepID=UPI003F5504A7